MSAIRKHSTPTTTLTVSWEQTLAKDSRSLRPGRSMSVRLVDQRRKVRESHFARLSGRGDVFAESRDFNGEICRLKTASTALFRRFQHEALHAADQLTGVERQALQQQRVGEQLSAALLDERSVRDVVGASTQPSD